MEVTLFSQAIQLIGNQVPDWKIVSIGGGFQGSIEFSNRLGETIALKSAIMSSKAAVRTTLSKLALEEMFGGIPEPAMLRSLISDQRICADGTRVYRNIARFQRPVEVKEKILETAVRSVPVKQEISMSPAKRVSRLATIERCELGLSQKIKFALEYAEKCRFGNAHRQIQVSSETGLTPLEEFMVKLLKEAQGRI